MSPSTLLYQLCLLFFSDCQSPDRAAELKTSQYLAGQRLISLPGKSLDEISGLATSHKHPDILWLHNDSGDDAVIYALQGSNGKIVNRVNLNRTQAHDWEDISRFDYQQQSWLLIADVGDNYARRNQVSLYALPEPSLTAPHSNVSWTLNFSYEDGPRDCEAVAVDSLNQEILLLSKRDKPPRLYRLALGDFAAPQTARFIGEVQSIPAPTAADLTADPHYGAKRSQVTAMSISADGQQLLLSTYKHSYLYQRHTQGWSEALKQAPRVIEIPQMAQTEAADFNVDANGIWLASEQLPAQLFFRPLPLAIP